MKVSPLTGPQMGKNYVLWFKKNFLITLRKLGRRTAYLTFSISFLRTTHNEEPSNEES